MKEKPEAPEKKAKKQKKPKKPREKGYLRLTFTISLLIFVAILSVMLLMAGIAALLIKVGVFNEDATPFWILFLIALVSTILGTLLTTLIIRFPFRSIQNSIRTFNRLAAGDFTARLHFSRFLSNIPALAELDRSFNIMAQELENTEMLRSDFVNNFSHEFKTPIVSIAGFASLLKRGNLTEAQRQEYLNAINEESMRLSAMATNVLNLSKVENQTILRDVTTFNLSEQIRACILLLESKWNKKKLELDPDFDEYSIRANEELLKQVWINLIDNAIKFSPDFGELKISIHKENALLTVMIENMGDAIPQEKLDRIFQKFYQVDESHATQGNGIGLAIVKKVIDLHGGTISVVSNEMKTVFSVTLPCA